MRDIGAVSGVSASTVSRVLNDAPSKVAIAAETRERVLRAARQVGYRPNPHARGLRGAPTMMLGVIVRDFGDPFFADALEALARAARAHGYNIVLGHARAEEGDALGLPAVLDTRSIDAIILMGNVHDQPQVIADLHSSLAPVVALWQGTSPVEFPTIDVDDRGGVVAAVELLASLGHGKIAFASANLPGGNTRREDAYVEQVEARFGQVPEGYVHRVANSLEGGDEALAGFADLPEPPTAVIASTDIAAVGVLHAAFARGIVVPRDLSVVGFDDIPIAAYSIPALTTVRMPVAEMIGDAVELAIALVKDSTVSRAPRVRVFAPSLVVRDSTSGP
jgi:DNA-binding LacI/PurR family transcriptional regulator